MKMLLNWRYYALFALFASGVLCVLVAAGEPEKPMSVAREWAQSFLCLGCGFGCFYSVGTLARRWEHRALIPEFTKLKPH